MNRNILSQAELDALLGNGLQDGSSMRDLDMDTLTELVQVCVQSTAQTLQQHLTPTISLHPPEGWECTWEEFRAALSEEDYLALLAEYGEPIRGGTLSLFTFDNLESAAAIIPGGAATGEALLYTIVEQFANTLNSLLDESLETRLGIVERVGPDGLKSLLPLRNGEEFIAFRFGFFIENVTSLEGHLLLPVSVAEQLISALHHAPPPSPRRGQRREARSVYPAQFPPLRPDPEEEIGQDIHLLADVELDLYVELGQTQMKVEEVLQLGISDYITLDKTAGEQVEVYINQKAFARGEVIVIDEHLAVKLTDIIEPEERLDQISIGSE